MLRVKKQPDSKGRNETLDESQVVTESMAVHTELFPEPNPPIDQFNTDIQFARDKIRELEIIEAQKKLKAEEVRVAIKKVTDDYSEEATYVELIANGNKETIYAAGMSPVSTSRNSISMPQILNVHFVNLDRRGIVRMAWDAVKDSRSYIIRSSTDILDTNSWQILQMCTKSTITIENLPSGTTMWFTIVAFGTNGEGAPSEPISIVIP